MADVIVNAATHRNVQILVESHSEHFLLRLQRRIAENKTISTDDVCLYFCDNDSGQAELTLLKLDHVGKIENWPKEFMGNAFQETAAAELARLSRMEPSNPEESNATVGD